MGAVARAINGKAITKPIRVLMVTPPASGGLARHVVALLDGMDGEGLPGQGYQVGVACPPEGPVAEAARARSMPVYGISVGAGGPSGMLLSVVQLARAVGAMHAQIIHTHSFRAGLVGALVRRGAPRARLVATIHNFPPGTQTMQARRSRERWAVRTLLRRADRLIAVSEAVREHLLALRPEVAKKSVTIPNGVDTTSGPADGAAARSALGLPAEGPIVGMIARLAPAKGIAEFIHCCRLLAEEWPSAAFVLAGGGPLFEEAIARRAEFGLTERLRMLGEVESAREVLGALNVVVVASTSEGSSVVAMEAMACGKPVVATSVGGLPEVVAEGETGLLAPPGDPEALAEAVGRMLADSELAHRMGAQGRQRAGELFDVRVMVSRVKEVYADLLREELEATGGRR